MKHTLIIGISILLFISVLPTVALCKLSAEAELQYKNYDIRDNTSNHLSAHSLTQRYSLLYQKEGTIVDGRLGKYNISLGYDWTTFDTAIKSTTGSENPSASRGHILYRGDLLIDPKELPLRFTAYSMDMNRSSFTFDDSNLIGSLKTGSLIGTPNLTTGITDGIHMNSGATLVMGVKNGMTNGYNELLRHFPMLMLDYRDSINRDLNASFPVNNRTSRLAFVSLNKKDNWFHYRLLSYEDYINPDNNYKESQIQLGTVDQTMQRRWIDFSNWLMVSADGQLTKRMNATTADNYNEFNLNLFGIARREMWEVRSFNNFNRRKDEDGTVTYRTSVPVYANGSLNADTSWNTRFSYKEDHDNLNNQFTDVTGGYRIDTFKRAPFTLSQQLDLEKASSNSADIFVISAALETTSTARFSSKVGLGATYNIRNYSYDGTTNANNFMDQSLSANATYSPSSQMRMSLKQTNRMTSGTSQYITSTISGAGVATPQYVDPRNFSGVNGSSYQSITDLTFSWIPLPRLNTSLSVNEDIYIPQNAPRSYKTNFVHATDYSGTNFKLTTRNTFTVEKVEPGSNSYFLTSANNAQYTFNRNLDSSVLISYYKGIGRNSDETDTLDIRQSLNYNYYKTNGITRKLFEISESFQHTEGRTANTNNITTVSTTNRTSALSLGGRYYPLRQLVVAAGSKYSFFNSISDYTLTYYASLGLNFRLFQASLDYAYGTARSDGRIEKKFTANFKKAF